MSIDYAAQFKLIDYTTADEMTAGWKRHRVYTDAKKAFDSAARTEARGIDVAFATTGFGQFHVWAEQRPAEDVITPMTEVGEEEIANMVAVKCVACSHLVTDRTAMAHMWNVDTACPACGDGALLWDDGSLRLREERAAALLAQYDAAVAEYVAISEEPGARDKHIMEAQYAIDDLTGDLAEALRGLL